MARTSQVLVDTPEYQFQIGSCQNVIQSVEVGGDQIGRTRET
jgi:hypothetical protein